MRLFLKIKSMKKLFYSFLMICILSVTSCKTKQFIEEKPQINKLPEWVNSRPILKDYFVGIGMARKTGTGDTYISIARNNALNDLVSEISINISGNSTLYQFDNRFELKEEFNSYTNTTIKENLEGYELAGSWGDDSEYWVFYKLSKKLYSDLKSKKLEDIKKRALSFFEKASEFKENKDFANAIIFYLKTFDVIKKNLSDELTIFSPTQGRIDLGVESFKSLQEILKNIRLKPNIDRLFVSQSTPIKNDLIVKASYITKNSDVEYPVESLPIRFTFEKGRSVLDEKISTNKNGDAVLSTAKVSNKGKIQQLKASLDIETMMGELSQDPLMKQLFSFKNIIPECRITVEVEGKRAYLISEEVDFGINSFKNIVSNGIKKELAEKLYSFTDNKENADVIITMKTQTNKGTYLEKNDLYIVYLDFQISVIDNKTQTEIYNGSINNLKGMQIRDYDNALMDVQQKVLQKFRSEIIPEMLNIEF